MIQTEEDATTRLSPDDVRQQFVDNRDDKSYRHAYADESLNLSIATQIKVLREQRELRQKDLAELAGMKQSMISRYENVNYSSWSINTLKKLAEAFDVMLDVRFRSFRDLVTLTQEFSRETLQVPSFLDDPYFSEGYTSRQVFTTYTYLPPARTKTLTVRFVFNPLLQASHDIVIPFSNLGMVRNQGLIEPEGVIHAEDAQANIQTYPFPFPYPYFIGGSDAGRVQRPSAD
jgi:transcriptional regulator with XRE-family HTH domain